MKTDMSKKALLSLNLKGHRDARLQQRDAAPGSQPFLRNQLSLCLGLLVYQHLMKDDSAGSLRG